MTKEEPEIIFTTEEDGGLWEIQKGNDILTFKLNAIPWSIIRDKF